MIIRTHSLKMIAVLALVMMTVAGLASCGGGGSSSVSGSGGSPPVSGGGDQMTIMPPTGMPDHSNTPVGATAIALSANFQGRINSPNDVDYFRLRVDAPGTLTIRTTGNADPDIAVFDGAGIEVPGVSGSWIGNITQDILDRGRDLLVRFSGGNAGAEYTGSATLDQRSQGHPDLSVGSSAVNDNSPETGGSFTLSVTVSNDGDGAAVATTLRYYRSTDATITTSDTSVGTDAVSGLAVSGNSAESILLTAPSSVGTYYYGACVDAVSGESDTINNCSTSVQVDVSGQSGGQTPQRRPDLASLGVFLASGTLDGSPGRSFTLRSFVRNSGDAEAPATTLRFYRSRNRTITTTDTLVGSVAVGPLAASGETTSELLLSQTAPSSAGTYYYGACVDAVAGESDTTNNCTLSLTMTVDGPSPDLVVGGANVTEIREDGTFWLGATVRNQGDGGAAATTARYKRSTDAAITTSDMTVGTDEVGTLFPAGGYGATINLTAPSTPGTYYYGVCVDAVAGESDTNNNCSVSVRVEVGGPPPDLVVLAPSVSAINETFPLDGTFSLVVTVRNQGGGTAAATTVRYYRSTDGTITTSDTELHTGPVNRLSPSETSEATIVLAAPETAGTYYYGACVDAVPRESDTINNCSSAGSLVVN